jgi:hypothetical protein
MARNRAGGAFRATPDGVLPPFANFGAAVLAKMAFKRDPLNHLLATFSSRRSKASNRR